MVHVATCTLCKQSSYACCLSLQIIPLSCEHGGTARDGVCMCAAGYMGDTCETGMYRFGAGNAASSSRSLAISVNSVVTKIV